MNRMMIAGAVCIVALIVTFPGFAQQQASAPQPARPVFRSDGVVEAPAFELPLSTFLSPEAAALQRRRAEMDVSRNPQARGASLASALEEMQRRYRVRITEETIGGVPTRIVLPEGDVANSHRVLVNLHGGGFVACEVECPQLESIPIAAIGRYKVVTVNYRQAPDHAFPAASEDVAAVYRDLLRTYRPENIGVYGCSAGGALAAQAAAYFQRHDLPTPGALGIFGAGGVRLGAGDSAYVAAYIDGSFPPPPPGGGPVRPTTGYFRGADMNDPLVSPALHPEVIGRFPPTLIITGTRAADLSPAIVTNSALLNAGVDSQLVVGEGMGHCYIYQSQLPEAQQAYGVIMRFFDRHLGVRGRSAAR